MSLFFKKHTKNRSSISCSFQTHLKILNYFIHASLTKIKLKSNSNLLWKSFKLEWNTSTSFKCFYCFNYIFWNFVLASRNLKNFSAIVFFCLFDCNFVCPFVFFHDGETVTDHGKGERKPHTCRQLVYFSPTLFYLVA